MIKLRRTLSLLLLTVLMLTIGALSPLAESVSILSIDMTSKTGQMRHGSAGFLYGLGSDGTPNVNLLTPLKPGTAVQKAPDGMQHPTGDVLDVTETFLQAGGEQVQIYMQDIFALWAYEYTGMEDYLSRIRTMVPKIVQLRESSSDYAGKIVYIPFNEPDGIWYNNIDSSAAVQASFNADWKRACDLIRKLDPEALIGGANFAAYRANAMKSWVEFCANNNCMPEYVTWHVLHPDKLEGFASNELEHYRSLERTYGLTEREIIINEYALQSECGVPGELVNWIALFEENKISGCLPYWHNAGNLNDLAADNNEPNGAWWLYKWYGDMSGETLRLATSTARADFYGLAALDDEKKLSTVLFGGAGGGAELRLQNIDKTESFSGAQKLNVTIEATYWTAFHGAAPEPEIVLQGTYPVKNGMLTIEMDNIDAMAAYRLKITPASESERIGAIYRGAWRKVVEAEDSELFGGARINSGDWSYAHSGTNSEGKQAGWMDSQEAGLRFTLDVPEDGYYRMDLIYGNGVGLNTLDTAANYPRTVRETLSIDGGPAKILILENTLRYSMQGMYTDYCYLTRGTHEFEMRGALDGDGVAEGVDTDCFVFTYVGAEIPIFDKIYEAEFGDFNQLASLAQTDVYTETKISGYSAAGYICGLDKTSVPNGGGVRFTVMVEENGLYNLSVRYAADADSMLNIYLDNTALTLNRKLAQTALPATNGGWAMAAATVFLQQGINIIDMDTAAAAAIDYLRVRKSNADQTIVVEAESGLLEGGASIVDNSYARGGSYVSNIQGATNDALLITVDAPLGGEYRMVLWHSNSELFGAHSYNAQIVDRYASVKVNDSDAVRLYFKNTYSDESFRPVMLPVTLKKGENTIRIYNDNWRILTCGTGSSDNITYHTLVNYTPNFDYFTFTPSKLDAAAVTEERNKITVIATDGGTWKTDKSFAAIGENICLTLTADDEEKTVSVTLNGENVSSRLLKNGRVWTLNHIVTGDTSFAVWFKAPENTAGLLSNNSFGTGDLSGWTAENVQVSSDIANLCDGDYYAEVTDGALAQNVTAEEGYYSFAVLAKGSGTLELSCGGEMSRFILTDSYERCCVRVRAASTEVLIRVSGTACIDAASYESVPVDESLCYFVNAGDSNPQTLSEGDAFGLYNSVTEQFYGKDPQTGMYWGIDDVSVPSEMYPGLLTGAMTWPYEYDTTDGVDKVLSFRYARNQDSLAEKPGVTYRFSLPSDGEYYLEAAVYAPSGWIVGNINRKSRIMLNGEIIASGVYPSTDALNPAVVSGNFMVKGGEAAVNISLESDGSGGPMLSYLKIGKARALPSENPTRWLSDNSFNNRDMSGTYTGVKQIEYDITPLELTDGIVALCGTDSPADNWNQYNITIRLRPDGTMDAINGTVFSSDTSVPYEVGKRYHVCAKVDIGASRYSVFVSDEDGDTKTLADNAAFRSDTSNLNRVCVRGGYGISAGQFYVENFCVSEPNDTVLSAYKAVEDDDSVLLMAHCAEAAGCELFAAQYDWRGNLVAVRRAEAQNGWNTLTFAAAQEEHAYYHVLLWKNMSPVTGVRRVY
ncbi:MAG: hypothetical protein Q4C12_06525 [Clostridia bacterium]|nr:hypothetical protein [Clostridia bacterium]